ncbi:phosphonate C-P lyase system protein PhnH [Geitlerinema sp. PCC 9228]|jgi:alpha-D-ribose 1-methylphosphonate 5-triphosphate synthase subunit PhnH|uniref:phosphonate C-P lyase system protein PhnH n=1 Tax=Geitlerinema sp. PCC 9228 TaxID=111611 RepID=UPI0008F9A6C8|nr:phosphonate C-P lyase system protein PhnH [Geitlerinema sp. PCC 9228]
MTVQQPGFAQPITDAQQTFRELLTALSQPAQPRPLPIRLQPPTGLNNGCAVACLTLLDLETQVWLQPGFSAQVREWLLFHTGCRFSDSPPAADFAIIGDSLAMPALSAFCPGTALDPERSTTLFVQLPSFAQSPNLPTVSCSGPGILHPCELSLVGMPPDFWQQWQQNTRRYPLGVDIVFFTEEQVLGLPRTTQVSL